MPICAAYARYSSEDQKPTSIDDQLRRCREVANKLGLSIDERRTFTDSALSGRDTKRAGYKALKQAAEDKLFDVLIVDELSRLGRDMLESMAFALMLTKQHLRLVTCDGLDTNDPNWRLPFIVKSFSAEQEVEQLAWRVRRGIDGALERGGQVGPPPYGYRLARRTTGARGCRWEIVEAEATIVREIFDLRVKGRSCNQIAEELESRGVPPKGADRRNGSRMWRPAAVHNLIRNTIYRGVLERGTSSYSRTKARKRGKEVEATTYSRPEYRLVDDTTWFLANQQSDITGASRRARWGTGRRLLSGLVSCGECGSTIAIGGDAVSRTMYCPSCYLAQKHGHQTGWLGYTSEASCRQALLWALEQLMTPTVVDEFRATLRRALEDGPTAELHQCEQTHAQVTLQVERLRRLLLVPGLADDEVMIDALSRAKEQQRELAARLRRLQAEWAGFDKETLERQLTVDPRELLEPLLAAPNDVPHLNAVLRRLVPRFAFVGRERRYHAVFEIEFDMGSALAAATKSSALSRERIRYRVEVTGSPHRPIRWEVCGHRI